MRTQPRLTGPRVSLLGLAVLFCFVGLARAQASETITATAQVKGRGGLDATAPVTIIIERYSTETERDEIMAALKKGGTEAVRNLLSTHYPIGSIKVGSIFTALKFIYAKPSADGQVITAVTGSPIAFIGAGVPGAPLSKSGFDLGLVMLEVGSGHGELVPATKVRLNEEGAIVTQDYSGEVVQLRDVKK